MHDTNTDNIPIGDGAEVPIISDPKCPYCNTQPLLFSSRDPIKIGRFEVVVFFCANTECAKVLTIAPISRTDRIVRPT